MRIKTLLSLFVFLLPLFLFSQTTDKDDKPSGFEDLNEIIYFTPGISAVTIDKGAIEVNLFNAFTFGQEIYNFVSPPYQKLPGSQKAFNSTLRAMFGLSFNKNFDLGFDINYTAINVESTDVSFFRAGPRVRWRPFGAISESLDVTIQNSLQFVIRDKDNLFTNQPELSNQILLTKYFLDQNLLLLLNAGITFQTKSSVASFDRKIPFSIPLSFIVGYYPRTDIIVYTGLAYSRQMATVPWASEDKRFLRVSATNLLIGGQYLLDQTFSVFLTSGIKLSTLRGGGAHSIVIGGNMLLN